MIEKLKELLLSKLNQEIEEYNKLKEKYETMAEKIKEDNSDQEYDQKKKALKAEYGTKRFSKKQEYQQKLQEIEKEYEENLKAFRSFYEEYNKVKKKLFGWNIYHTKRRIDMIPHYKTLKDFHMSREQIEDLITEGNMDDIMTDDDYKQLSKLK